MSSLRVSTNQVNVGGFLFWLAVLPFLFAPYSGPGSNSRHAEDIPSNPLLPKITMVGISTSEPGRLNRSSIKKTMDDLTRELEQASQKLQNDPLFVANVGDYSSFVKTSST